MDHGKRTRTGRGGGRGAQQRVLQAKIEGTRRRLADIEAGVARGDQTEASALLRDLESELRLLHDDAAGTLPD